MTVKPLPCMHLIRSIICNILNSIRYIFKLLQKQYFWEKYNEIRNENFKVKIVPSKKTQLNNHRKYNEAPKNMAAHLEIGIRKLMLLFLSVVSCFLSRKHTLVVWWNYGKLLFWLKWGMDGWLDGHEWWINAHKFVWLSRYGYTELL